MESQPRYSIRKHGNMRLSMILLSPASLPSYAKSLSNGALSPDYFHLRSCSRHISEAQGSKQILLSIPFSIQLHLVYLFPEGSYPI